MWDVKRQLCVAKFPIEFPNSYEAHVDTLMQRIYLNSKAFTEE